MSGREEIQDFLSYEETIWIPSHWGKKKKTYRKSLIDKYNYFLTGFIPELVSQFHLVNITGFEKPPLKRKPVFEFSGYKLKSHQIDLFLSGLTKHRGILKSPTGSGKTLVAGALIHSIPNVRCIFLVHNKSLFSQAISDFTKYFPDEIIGWFGAGLKPNFQRITVAMVNSLIKVNKAGLKDISRKFDMFIVDECHHAISNSYYYVLTHFNQYYRFGMSATPKDSDDIEKEYKRVIGLIGEIIEDVKITDIPEILAKPICYFIQYKQNPFLSNLDWPIAYHKGIVTDINRNKAIKRYVEEHSDQSILITVKLKEQGEILSQMIPGSILLFGKDSTLIRDEIKDLLNRKKTKVVISTVFGEGVNIPELNTIIRAEAGLSKTKTIQEAGRSMRKTSEKSEGIVVDFADEENRHLMKHYLVRLKTYEKNDFEIRHLNYKGLL